MPDHDPIADAAAAVAAEMAASPTSELTAGELRIWTALAISANFGGETPDQIADQLLNPADALGRMIARRQFPMPRLLRRWVVVTLAELVDTQATPEAVADALLDGKGLVAMALPDVLAFQDSPTARINRATEAVREVVDVLGLAPDPDRDPEPWVERCGKCRWFLSPVEGDTHALALPDGWAQCRRNPPQIAGWPNVHEGMNCGEYRPRD